MNHMASRKPLRFGAPVLQCRGSATGAQCSSADSGSRRRPAEGRDSLEPRPVSTNTVLELGAHIVPTSPCFLPLLSIARP